MKKKCRHCSSQLRENVNFCTRCGNKVDDVQGTKRRRKLVIQMIASVLILTIVVGSIYVVNRFKDGDTNTSSRKTNEEDSEIEDERLDEFVINMPEKAIIIEGKVIAEGTINPEGGRLAADDGNVAMSFDSLCIEKSMEGKITEVTIENPPEDTILNIYSFQLESIEELDGVATLEVPYDASKIPDGMTASECVTAVYYHEELREWVDETCTIDEDRQVVLISTTHLSAHGTKITLTPLEESLDDFVIRVANGTPYERAIPQNVESLVNRLSQEDMEKILNSLNTYGAGEPTQILTDASIKFLSDGGSFVGIGNEFLLRNPYNKALYEKMSTRLGKFTGGLVLVQLISDVYYEKPAGQIYFNTAKGLTFWKGAAVGTAIGGPVGGTVATVVLAGMFLLDVSGIAPIDIPLYIEETNHRAAVAAYELYYKDQGRSDGKWMEVAQGLIQEVAEEGLTGDEFNKRFKELLKENVTDYTEDFFGKDKTEILTYMESAFAATQGYLGTYSRVYSTTDEQRNKQYVEEYTDEILEGEYNGVTTSLVDELQAKYKKELLEKKIPRIMKMRAEHQYLKQLDYLRVTLLEMCQMLNSTFYIQFIDSSVASGRTSKYESYYVAPIIKEALPEYQPEKWVIQLNSEGEGQLNMNVLAHYRSEYFTEFGLYTKDAYDGILDGTAKPVKTLPLGTISKNTHSIDIAGDDAKIQIDGDRLTTIEVVGGEPVEHTLSAVSEYSNECYILWNFGDGDEFKEEGNKSKVTHEFKEEGEYSITAALYDESNTLLADDQVTINIVYVDEGVSIKPPKSITYELVDGATEAEHTFEATAMPYGEDYLFEWDFGDGTAKRTTEGKDSSITHTYKEIGTFNPQVILYSKDGNVLAKDSMTVILETATVQEEDPVGDCGFEVDFSKLEKVEKKEFFEGVGYYNIYYVNQDGKRHGPDLTWHDEARMQPSSTRCWYNGLLRGKILSWYPSGNIMSEAYYNINGLPEGTSTSWYDNGQMWDVTTFPVGMSLDNIETSQIFSISWYENGQKRHESSSIHHNQHGAYAEWYSNGNKKVEATYNNGELIGAYTSWYENGSTKETGTYAEDERKTGIWNYWDENGVNTVTEYR